MENGKSKIENRETQARTASEGDPYKSQEMRNARADHQKPGVEHPPIGRLALPGWAVRREMCRAYGARKEPTSRSATTKAGASAANC
jgi:hypothetical protein